MNLIEHFDMARLPFGKSSPTTDLFEYAQLKEMHALLSYAMAEKSMALITGQAGAGKTTAARLFIDSLPTNRYQTVYLGQDQNGSNLLKRLAITLGITPGFHRQHTLMHVSQFLLENLQQAGREIILVADEAHLFDDRTLEEIRLLTNADFDKASPITVILIGQLPLRSRLRAPGHEALNQRLRVKYHLEGLTLEETSAYIKHQLKLAGIKPDLFADDVTKQIFMSSEGIVREINNLCILAMLRAQALSTTKIDSKLMRQVLDQRELN
jgi:type II secretory pathway predicted ATPase ExeA